MGLLDSKKQFLDTIVTDEGRRQMARGKINIRFATFTDQDVFYEGCTVSGTTDASQRPHLEAFSRPQDRITFEADDVGNLLQFKGAKDSDVIGGHVLVTSGSKFLNFPPIGDRRDAQLGLLTSSLHNFCDLYALSTEDPLDDDNAFTLGAEKVFFDVTDGMLDERQGIDVATLDDVDSLFQDRRLSHAPNFRYMPPRNAATVEAPDGPLLGQYPKLDQGQLLTFEELTDSLSGMQRQVVRFTETSRESNIFGQFFDVRNDVLRKLDVIDFGEFIDADPGDGSNHVFFVGRLFRDSKGSHTFINLFTLVFS